MQVKVFSGFSEAEVRQMRDRWHREHPDCRVMREKAVPSAPGFGRFEGKRLFQIVVEYEEASVGLH